MAQVLTSRDWISVRNEVVNTSPHNYALLDDFLTDHALSELRDCLLSSRGWYDRTIPRVNEGLSWLSEQSFNRSPQCRVIQEIEAEVKANLPELLEKKNDTSCWAIISSNNDGVFPHCDGGAVSLNLWLTPETSNLTPSKSGMLLFDVKRNLSMSPAQYASEKGGCVDFVTKSSLGNIIQIPYKYNRAILFDAWTFHATDIGRFAGDAPSTGRMNLTFTFE